MVRLPDGLRGKIAEASRARRCSMNTYIVRAMESSDPIREGSPSDEALISIFRRLSPEKQAALMEFLKPQ